MRVCYQSITMAAACLGRAVTHCSALTEYTMKYGLRWLAVVPAAVLAAVLSAVPLHLVLYQTLTGSGFIEPYPETPERVLLPLVAAMSFVWAGARVAPSHKMETAVVLFGSWLLLAGASIALILSGAHFGGLRVHSYGDGLSSMMALFGAFAGLYFVRRERIAAATTSTHDSNNLNA